MLKRGLTLLGALLILFGAFFALQGADIIHWPQESMMLGRGVWIRNGLMLAALGVAVLLPASACVPTNKREGFCDLSRSVARSVRRHVSTRDELRAQKTRAKGNCIR